MRISVILFFFWWCALKRKNIFPQTCASGVQWQRWNISQDCRSESGCSRRSVILWPRCKSISAILLMNCSMIYIVSGACFPPSPLAMCWQHGSCIRQSLCVVVSKLIWAIRLNFLIRSGCQLITFEWWHNTRRQITLKGKVLFHKSNYWAVLSVFEVLYRSWYHVQNEPCKLDEPLYGINVYHKRWTWHYFMMRNKYRWLNGRSWLSQ